MSDTKAWLAKPEVSGITRVAASLVIKNGDSFFYFLRCVYSGTFTSVYSW